jgi:esterase/lipase superfamily enzyme
LAQHAASSAQPEPRPSEREPIALRADGGPPLTGVETADRLAEPVPARGTPESSSSGAAEGGYHVVKVFYGTDRKPGHVSEPRRSKYLGWLYLTVLCAGVSALLMLAAVCVRRRSTLLVLAGAGVAATVALGVVTTLVRLQGEPVGPRPQRTYGNQRGELEMGVCEVSIPARHEVGAVERPSLLRLELQEDPRRHIVLLGVEEQPAGAFFADLRARVEASSKKAAFVFVHGFNMTFEEAAHRTAQLAYDLRFDGAPIFFSWPSQGGLLQYSVDETNVVWTVPHLKQFLVGIAQRSDAESLHLIAHSMGNRALTAALEQLRYEMREEQPLFHEVVLTAPDIDADVFHRDIVPAIVPTAERVTLYASSNDEALKFSKRIHGYLRAGDSGSDLLVIPGVDTIDVSTVDTSLIGHLYYGDNATVIADMLDLINQSKPPQLRPWLRPRRFGELMYWVFHSDTNGLEISQPAPPSIRR